MTDFIEDPSGLERDLPGSSIEDVSRYGKYVVLQLSGAACPPTAGGDGANPERGGAGADHAGKRARSFLLVHLGMTGQLVPRRPEEPVAPHTHAFFTLDDGRELRYADIRRFGRLGLVREAELERFVGRLGLDPLDATEAEFCERLAGRRARVKALLLDQRVLRGIGNIYADESLWRARIHPARQAARLSRQELGRMYRAIASVLTEAIRLRGSSVSNYVDADGRPGEYQRRHRVYRREGKGCFRCGTMICRITVAGRSSYFCPRCQPA